MAFSAQAFLHEFLLPLVAGGRVNVGEPLDAGDLADLRADCATPSDVTIQIEAARGRTAEVSWLYPVQTPVDDATLRLALGLHNTLFLSHPAARRWSVRSSALQRVVELSADCLALGAPVDEQQLVARHTVLARLEELSRTDVEVSFWVGKRFFCGMEPPPRLLAWSGVRRVEQRRQHVNWLGSELSDAQRLLVDLLLWQSPLTALLTPLRRFPVFTLATLFPYLGHRLVCRAACQRYLEIGLGRVGPLLARDFWRLAGAPSAPFEALTSDQRGWLEAALRRWAPPCARHTSETSSRLALRMMAALVQYLYAAECLVREPTLDLGVGVEPDEALCSVLVAATDCGLVVDVEHQQVADRIAALLSAARGSLGDAAGRQTHLLRGALHR